MKKVIIMLEFGTPLGWEQKFIDQFPYAGKGWYCRVFTPNDFKGNKQVEVIKMTIEEFDSLMEKKLGVNAHNFIKENGEPDKLISDYYPAFGAIFEDYIKGFDFWGHANWDVIWGKMNHFIPDDFLETIDIFSDEPDTINGVFTIYRNNEKINNLFKESPEWKRMFTEHHLFVFDENPQYMPAVAKKAHAEGRIVFFTPNPEYHSYEKGATLKLDNGLFANGKEVLLFHFSRVRPKVWPL